MRDCHVVKCFHLLGRTALETDRAAIRASRRFAVNRFGNAKAVSLVAVKEPGMAGRRGIPERFSYPQRCQYRVVKLFRALDIVGTDHDVAEHAASPYFVLILWLIWYRQYESNNYMKEK
jgi:hypothetical protein